MNIFDVFYCRYFLFYKSTIKDPEPHFATVLGLSFNESLLLNGSMSIIALKWFCFRVEVWFQVLLTALIILFNYLIYHKYGRARIVIEQKPLIGNSKKLSVIVTWLFFVITSSWLFWGPIYGKYLLGLCR